MIKILHNIVVVVIPLSSNKSSKGRMECIYCATYEEMQRIYVNILKLVLANIENGYLSTEKRFHNKIIHFCLKQNL